MLRRNQRFYYCPVCGNIVTLHMSMKKKTKCCGKEMRKLTQNKIEDYRTSHTPSVFRDGNIIRLEISDLTHPMAEEHFIEWVYLMTKNGGQRQYLSPGNDMKAEFELSNEDIVSAFVYCNLHGLWGMDLYN